MRDRIGYYGRIGSETSTMRANNILFNRSRKINDRLKIGLRTQQKSRITHGEDVLPFKMIIPCNPPFVGITKTKFCNHYTVVKQKPTKKCIFNVVLSGGRNTFTVIGYSGIATSKTIFSGNDIHEITGSLDMKLWRNSWYFYFKGNRLTCSTIKIMQYGNKEPIFIKNIV